MTLESVSALILDDNAHMRGLVRAILAGFGMRQIGEAADCNSALATVAGGEIDIAFVDLKLGGLDGLEFCRRIRLDPESPNRYLPIIMITAYSERSRVIDAINAGVDEFLVKPIRAVDVANRVNAVIERRRPFVQTPGYFGPDRRRRDDPRYRGPWRRASDPGTVDI
ncbi:MAG: response regulator [Hyphomonadaceae bacterium]